jgi:hypothetical protein
LTSNPIGPGHKKHSDRLAADIKATQHTINMLVATPLARPALMT